jgi:hypothetical protein
MDLGQDLVLGCVWVRIWIWICHLDLDLDMRVCHLDLDLDLEMPCCCNRSILATSLTLLCAACSLP